MTRARVKPELIRWVRKDAGLSVADAAKKAGTSEAIVRQWEEGTLQPTIRQLRLLANAAKRPIAIFYLAEPPWKFTALRDFRRLPGDPLADQSSALRLAVRLACERRQVALDLAADLDDLPPALPIRASLEEPVVVNTRDAPNGRVFTLFHESATFCCGRGASAISGTPEASDPRTVR